MIERKQFCGFYIQGLSKQERKCRKMQIKKLHEPFGDLRLLVHGENQYSGVSTKSKKVPMWGKIIALARTFQDLRKF